METRRTIRPVNGIGPAVGMSPRDYLREREQKRAVVQSPTLGDRYTGHDAHGKILGLRKLSR